MRSLRFASPLVAALVAALSATAFAQQSTREARIAGVRIIGASRQSSTGSPSRWPQFELQNHSASERVVRVISLVSIDGPSRRSHRGIAPTSFRLSPSQTRTIELHYQGTPNNDGVGAFTTYRFHITVEVNGTRATIEATSHYVCRIPVVR